MQNFSTARRWLPQLAPTILIAPRGNEKAPNTQTFDKPAYTGWRDTDGDRQVALRNAGRRRTLAQPYHEELGVAHLPEANVRQQCAPGERIFGDYYFAPFAAAVSDCVVAADLVDTNTHRIKAGESSLEQWLEAVDADGLSLVVARFPGWMTRQPEVRHSLLDEFPEVVFAWRDPHVGRVELRRRIEESSE